MSLNVGTRRSLLGTPVPYSDKVMALAPIAYWPLWEASGSTAYDISGNGLDGSYTGVTLGQAGIGDGKSAPRFDGSTSFVDVYSAGLNTAFSGALGSISVWMKVFNAAVWTDGTAGYVLHIYADGNNRIRIIEDDTNDQLYDEYKADGTAEGDVESISLTSWIHLGLTWNKSGNEVSFYYNGVQTGPDTIAGTWAGNLDTNLCCIGAYQNNATLPFNGWLARCAIFDTALTSTQVADLATL
jgi:hypothetical protein